jgi:hypothetical protein
VKGAMFHDGENSFASEYAIRARNRCGKTAAYGINCRVNIFAMLGAGRGERPTHPQAISHMASEMASSSIKHGLRWLKLLSRTQAVFLVTKE